MELRYYTTREIAELLEVRQNTVRVWIREGVLKAERGSGQMYLIREGYFFNFAYQVPLLRERLAGKLDGFRYYINLRHTTNLQAAMLTMYPGLAVLAKRWANERKQAKSEEG